MTKNEAVPSQLTQMSLVNIAARQRMLSQRMLFQTLLAAQGDPHQLQAAKASLALFSASQKHLEDCGAKLGTEASAAKSCVWQTYHGPQGVAPVIREFQAAMTRMLSAIDTRHADLGAQAAQLVKGNDQVLAALNRATESFDAVAMQRSDSMKKNLADVVSDIQRVAREARVVSFNARVMAARAGDVGREFNVVAEVLIGITEQVDRLSLNAMGIVADMG